MRGDYQQLVDEISAVLGAPATLEDRDFGLIAFGAHGSASDDDSQLTMDPVRTRSILHRSSTAAVRAWFEAFGITRATGPLRIPPDPAAGVVMGRICLPVRHGGVVHGYVWLLDDGHLSRLEIGRPGVPPDPVLAQAMDTAARIGALLAAEARAGAEAGELLLEVLTGPPGDHEAALSELRGALGTSADGPLALVAVVPWRSASGPGGEGFAEDPGSGLAGQPGVAAMCVVPDSRGPKGTGGAMAPLGRQAEDAAGAGGAAEALAVLVRLRTTTVLDPAHTAAERLLRSPRAGAARGGRGRPGHGAAAMSAGGTNGRAGTNDRAGAGTRGGEPSVRNGTATAQRPAAERAAADRPGIPADAAAGISEPRRGLTDLPAAWREAVAAARVARGDARLGPVAEWAAIGPYRTLTRLPVMGRADPAVAPLLEPGRAQLAHTTEVFLDCAGQAGRAAAALGIHRQTLYYRLSRVEKLTGLDLNVGEDRLLLHMALKASRIQVG
ncbi:helix-turn-helix domain-containing protein [Streptomyces sp. NPDC051776]|uniref:PucR family transcriptional regulator n=1 Tax=Streptomyces sp. NPDC051776 TaxID=3155414 RepID=UPI0034327671